VAELADAPDLGSGGTPVQVQVLSPAPRKKPLLSTKTKVVFLYLLKNRQTAYNKSKSGVRAFVHSDAAFLF
jgi:hypothetical protein